MADKEKKKKKDDSALVAAAETVGAVVGKVAAALGVTADKPKTPPSKVKIPKLAKSGKSRLPRKEKKAKQKAAAALARK